MTKTLEDVFPNGRIFAWMSRNKNGRLVEAFGAPENWTHFRVTNHDRKYKTYTAQQLREMMK